MQKNQRHQLHALLEYVWVHSPFYRDFYSSHGIDGARLRDVAVTDLPLLPKKLLIENFDRAVTDQRLKRSELERWFEEHQDPRQRFAQDLVVIHGSGTSGDVGIFAYNQREWQIADATIAGRLPPPVRYPASKTRIAFLVAAHGHFATVSMALSTLGTVYETLIVSPLDPIEQTLSKLSSFQPDRLHGYSSSVAELAQLCIAGRLDIRPKRVLVGGDKLTSAMEADIRDAWDAAVHVVYAASESKYIAIRNPGAHDGHG